MYKEDIIYYKYISSTINLCGHARKFSNEVLYRTCGFFVVVVFMHMKIGQ